MAFRTWSRLLLTALGVSVLTGAGQLGIAYGIGVVRLDGAFTDGAVNRWPAQLAWVGWFAAVAAVAGAIGTDRLARRDGSPGGTSEQLSLAGAAALGATAVAPLCMQPARAAELGGTVDPVWAVGICAILGALLGAGAAIVVLRKPPFGWSIALTTAAVWLFALLSVAPEVSSAGPLVTVRLGVLEPSWLDAETAQRLAMLLLPLVALLAGAAVGALARRRGHLPLVGGAAGAAGPVLLAFVYLAAGPGSAADRYQLAPYYGVLIAVAAGTLGSAATTVLRRPIAEPETTALEPTDILQPLPPSITAFGNLDTAAGPPPAANGTVDAPNHPGVGPEESPAGAMAATPAHWDWPSPFEVTPAPTPAREPRAARPALDRTIAEHRQTVDEHRTVDDHLSPAERIRADEHPWSAGRARSEDHTAPEDHTADEPDPVTATTIPAAPEPDASLSTDHGAGMDEPVARRGADDLTRNPSVPGRLPPGRRTSAIDVLAAGRPAPQRPVEVEGPTSAPTSAPSPAAEEPPVGSTAKPAAPLGVAPVAAPTVPSGDGPPASERSARAAGHRSRRQPPPVPEQGPVKANPAEADGVRLDPAGTGITRVQPGAELDTADPVRARRNRADMSVPEGAPASSSAAEAPLANAAEPDSTGPRPGGRSRRGRKVRTSPATAPKPTEAPPVEAAAAEPTPARPASVEPLPTQAGRAQAAPVEAAPSDPHVAAPVAGVPERSAPPAPPAPPAPSAPAPRPAGGRDHLPGSRAPGLGEPTAATPDPANTDDGRRTSSYFFADEPVASNSPSSVEAPASPRPRSPIFEDAPDRETEVLPAWPATSPPSQPVVPAPGRPVVPAPGRPVAPLASTGPGNGTTTNNGTAMDDTTTDTGAATDHTTTDGRTTPNSDATSGTTGTPAAENRFEPTPRPRHRALPDLSRDDRWDAFANARRAAQPAGIRHTDTGEAAATNPAAEVEPDGGKSKLRRGLFRRNRAKDDGSVDAGRTEHEPEPLAAQDEEYVDWVAGLATDGNGEALRTGRHHRD